MVDIQSEKTTCLVLIERTMAPKAKVLKSGDTIPVLAHKIVGLHAASAQYGINSKTKCVSGNITVLAHKIVGLHAASAQYGINSKTRCASGNITGCNGRGNLQKWVVLFPVFNRRVFVTFVGDRQCSSV